MWKPPSAAVPKIIELFYGYLKQGEFVGADLARKYLQMGFTRARRYANYKGGKKYDKDHGYRQLERGTGENSKALAAAVFYEAWQHVEQDEQYQKLKQEWKKRFG